MLLHVFLLFVFLSLIYFIHNSFGEVYNFKEKWGSLCKLNETKWFCNIDELSTDDSFHFPTGIAVDNKGDVYVSDSWNDRVQKFTSNGKFITKWGTSGSADGQFRFPTGIAVDNKGDVYVGDSLNMRIQKFTSNGKFITKIMPEKIQGDIGTFENIFAIDLFSQNIFVTDSRTDSVEVFSINP